MTNFQSLESFFKETIKLLKPEVEKIERQNDPELKFQFYLGYLKNTDWKRGIRLAHALVRAGASKSLVKDAYNVSHGGFRASAN